MKFWMLRYVGRIGGGFLYFFSIVLWLVVFFTTLIGEEETPRTMNFIVISLMAFGGLTWFLSGRIPRGIIELWLRGLPDRAYVVFNTKTQQVIELKINPRLPPDFVMPIFPDKREYFQPEYRINCCFNTSYRDEPLRLSASVVVHIDEDIGLANLATSFARERELYDALQKTIEEKLQLTFPEIEVSAEKLENQLYLQNKIQETGTSLEKPPYHITSLSINLDSVVLG